MHVTANVILAKCTSENKIYGIRVERQSKDWVRTWAFPIQEDIAQQEGFDTVQIQGSLMETSEYPGCPYCKTNGFFICGTCGKLNCYHGEEWTTCEWCGNSAKTSGANEFKVEGGGY